MNGAELPLPDYDSLPVGAIESRSRTLDGHSQPSGGDPRAPAPEAGGSAAEAPQASPKEGPAINPPSHGDPTNPAQPRT
jgi:hypothetical protein